MGDFNSGQVVMPCSLSPPSLLEENSTGRQTVQDRTVQDLSYPCQNSLEKMLF